MSLRVDRNIAGFCSELCSANILLIDDDRLNLMALEGILSYNFHLKTISCDRGQDALEIFQKNLLSTCCASKFNLVLTDISMP